MPYYDLLYNNYTISRILEAPARISLITSFRPEVTADLFWCSSVPDYAL